MILKNEFQNYNLPFKHQFNNIGYLTHKFQEEELSFLREEVNDIKNNFLANADIAYNKQLAGNLQHEYRLTKSVSELEQLLIPYYHMYDTEFNYLHKISYATNNVPVTLSSLWVNYQSKTEFNPVHYHSGIISFVIYLDVPYSIQDEKQRINSVNSSVNVPGHFCLFYVDSMGQIEQEPIPVDRRFRNVLIMFPAKMNHCVYPFYTSDEYRISVSGNFSLNTANVSIE
jgi:hypothetical protein